MIIWAVSSLGGGSQEVIGFKGQFYIEPKPKEPTKHQYDSDAAACLNFLREYDLLRDFKLNLETNHATLAGHTMQHEMEVAIAAGALGSIDANTGDLLLGWDTDQFPTNVYLTTEIMLSILKMGGFKTGGTNFDAKVRRESFEPVDLFHAHIGGMDAFARGPEDGRPRARGRPARVVAPTTLCGMGPRLGCRHLQRPTVVFVPGNDRTRTAAHPESQWSPGADGELNQRLPGIRDCPQISTAAGLAGHVNAGWQGPSLRCANVQMTWDQTVSILRALRVLRGDHLPRLKSGDGFRNANPPSGGSPLLPFCGTGPIIRIFQSFLLLYSFTSPFILNESG